MNEIRKRLALALLLAIIIAGILTGINFITAKNGDPLLAKKYPGDNLTEWKGFGLYRVEFHNETVKDEDGQIRPLTRTEFDYESFLKILVITYPLSVAALVLPMLVRRAMGKGEEENGQFS